MPSGHIYWKIRALCGTAQSRESVFRMGTPPPLSTPHFLYLCVQQEFHTCDYEQLTIYKLLRGVFGFNPTLIHLFFSHHLKVLKLSWKKSQFLVFCKKSEVLATLVIHFFMKEIGCSRIREACAGRASKHLVWCSPQHSHIPGLWRTLKL